MAALIEEEGLDEDGQPKKQQNPRRPCKHKQVKKAMQEPGDGGSDNDSDFLSSSAGDELSSKSSSDGSEGSIPNDEVSSSLPLPYPIPYIHAFQLADMLPSKTAPITSKRTKLATRSQQQINRSSPHALKKSRKATAEDDDSHRSVRCTASPDPPAAAETMMRNAEQRKKVNVLMVSLAPLMTRTSQKPGGAKRANPVYLFYELVPQNASGQPGDPGDKHYRCCHGNHKILTVTKLMKSNLNGLCINFASMTRRHSSMFVRAHRSPEALLNNVPTLLHTQGPCRTPNCRRNWICLRKKSPRPEK